MSQQRTLSPCSAARRLSRCVFFHSIRTGIVLGTAPDSQDFVLNTRPPLVAPFRTDHTFAWACFDDRGASTQGQISCRVALKLQRRTELLVQRNARLWKRLQRAALFFDPKCLFSRPRAWFILFWTPASLFFDLHLFFNSAESSEI